MLKNWIRGWLGIPLVESRMDLLSSWINSLEQSVNKWTGEEVLFEDVPTGYDKKKVPVFGIGEVPSLDNPKSPID